jgi:hypothetical protein
MSVNLKELFSVIPSKSYADPGLTVENISKVWASISSFVQEALVGRKAANLADLGLFTFTQERNKLLPTFVLANSFLRAYNIKQTQKPPAIAGIEFFHRTYSQIARKCCCCTNQPHTYRYRM